MSDSDAYEADISQLSRTLFDNTSRFPIASASYSHVSANGIEHYSGDVTSVSYALGSDHLDGNVTPIDAASGSFSVTADVFGTPDTYSFQILGASTDGHYLVLGDLGDPSSPAYVYTASGYPFGSANPFNPPSFSFDTSNVYVGPVCYCAGTMILTPAGERPIETLASGDLVTTASGAVRPIVWMGRQTIACARHPHPAEAYPVLISRDAIGPGLPRRDLMVSPAHGIAITCLEPVFVEARALVNGATVRQVPVDRVEYHHLELETHDVVVANGLAAESYLDVGNRHHLGGVATLRPLLDPAADDLGSCHPRLADGPIVEAIRLRMEARAAALGWQVRPRTASFTITADDRALDVTTIRSLLRCEIVPDATSIELRSDTFSAPVRVGTPRDTRTFGIFVEEMTVIGADGCRTAVPLDHACFASGFWDIERGGVAFRWTDGDARIDLTLLSCGSGIAAVEIAVGLQQEAWALRADLHRAAALAA